MARCSNPVEEEERRLKSTYLEESGKGEEHSQEGDHHHEPFHSPKPPLLSADGTVLLPLLANSSMFERLAECQVSVDCQREDNPDRACMGGIGKGVHVGVDVHVGS
jgi:hypothetical protein